MEGIQSAARSSLLLFNFLLVNISNIPILIYSYWYLINLTKRGKLTFPVYWGLKHITQLLWPKFEISSNYKYRSILSFSFFPIFFLKDIINKARCYHRYLFYLFCFVRKKQLINYPPWKSQSNCLFHACLFLFFFFFIVIVISSKIFQDVDGWLTTTTWPKIAMTNLCR